MGVQWTTQRTRVLSIKGILAIEVEENELGILVTASFHIKVPPWHNGVFQVNIHSDTEGTYIIAPHPQLEEKNLNIFQHEIAIILNDEATPFPLIAMTNLDHAKTLHIGKGEIVGFAKPEVNLVTYIATTNEINIEEYIDMSPRYWIPKGSRKPLKSQPSSEMSINHTHTDQKCRSDAVNNSDKCEKSINHYNLEEEKKCGTEYSKKSDESTICSEVEEMTLLNGEKEINRSSVDKYQRQESTDWNDINEVIESDFLISPGDIYPNRKQDASIAEDTKRKFEDICDHYTDAFSKNNKDIGRTQLIEMEIDTGSSVPLAQSPYTLPLKHYDWVRNEIETLEKAGVIERSLSPWASPVIVVPKKSMPDEPPHRRLCVDYRKVNRLQQKIKRTDKGTGCLSLYPLPKIDEMFSKLCGAAIFSTIDL